MTTLCLQSAQNLWRAAESATRCARESQPFRAPAAAAGCQQLFAAGAIVQRLHETIAISRVGEAWLYAANTASIFLKWAALNSHTCCVIRAVHRVHHCTVVMMIEVDHLRMPRLCFFSIRAVPCHKARQL